MRLSPLLALIGLVVVGCTSTPPPQLEPYPGIGKQIINYYDNQSVSDNINCTTTQIQTLGDMKVLSDTPKQLVVSSQYFYWTPNFDKFHGGCQGEGTRTFTFDKAGVALTVVGMSGPQGSF